jgi:hypothetical protein
MSTIGVYQKSYISSLDPMLDTREIKKEITDIWNEEELTDILNLADRKKPIATGQPVYYTWVTESLFKSVTVSSISAGDNTTQLTLVLTAATSGYIKKQDLLKFPDNNVGIVFSVSTASGVDTIVVKSVAGANINTANGEVISIFSMAYGEKSSAPESERFGVTKYSNKYQIFSISDEITDVQNAATVEFTVNGQNRVAAKSHYEKRMKMKGQINAAFFGGDMSVTSFSDANPTLTDQNSGGLGVQTTRGFDKYVELYGVGLNAGSGAYSQGALDDAIDNLLAVRAPKEQLVISGDKAKRKLDTYFKSLGSSGVNSVRLVVDGKELDMTIEQVKYGKYTLNFTTMGILDHPVIFGQTVISKSLYFLPYNESVKTVGGGSEPAMSVRYIPNQLAWGDELIGESYDGALSPVNPVGTTNKWLTNWTTKQGLEFLAPQWALRQQVLA